MHKGWHQRLRGLTLLLLFSGGLNIFFLSRAIYGHYVREAIAKPQVVYHASHHEVLSQFFHTSYVDLVRELGNTEHVQEGLKRRDLALGCLVHFHYLDIERCMLPHVVYSKKMLFTNEEDHEAIEISVYPQFEDQHFKRIMRFFKTERWPLTPEGLYYELKGSKGGKHPSLRMALLTTPLLQKIASYLKRYYQTLCMQDVLELLLEGDWPLIAKAADLQGDSEEVYQFLCAFLSLHSPKAASILLEFHEDQLFHHANDQVLVELIGALKEHHPDNMRFLRRILGSLRKENVIKAASKQLKSYGIDPSSSKIDLYQSQKKQGVYREAKKHCVKEGDSLWKLSKMYGVPFNALIEVNNLRETELLTIGKVLIIPDQEACQHLQDERGDI